MRRSDWPSSAPALRARKRIRYTFWPPMHPAGLRCSSLTYAGYARSSRLAGRAPRRPQCTPYSSAGPKIYPHTMVRISRTLMVAAIFLVAASAVADDNWSWTGDGNVIAGFNYQKRLFANFASWESQNWFMGTGERPLAGGRLTIAGMLSLEPLT